MHLKPGLLLAVALNLLASVAVARAGSDRVIALDGEWRFVRGGPDVASPQADLPALRFADAIALPGTTDTNRKGPANEGGSTNSLSQPWQFTGTCWYERDVVIPADWRDKPTTLSLERSKRTQLWLDGRPMGERAVYCTPHEYSLGTLASGPHKLTIAVENKRLPPFGADAHQYSGNTQGNWNGIIGRMELRATDAASIDDVQAYPDAAARSVLVKVRVRNATAEAGEGTIVVTAAGEGVDATKTIDVKWTAGTTDAEVTLPLGDAAALWDEFHPALHKLTVRLAGKGIADERQVTFGLRTFATRGTQFLLNGRPIFLRGKHDACVFPLTGHPPMTVDGWLDYLKVCQSYGLNHIRFHTWTPPEAAFEAADRLGFYLQPELPFWGTFDAKVKDILKPEAERILRTFGNHPSFVMFSMGNEHWAGQDVLQSLVTELRAQDPRHLYVRGTSAFSYEGRPGKGDDYLITSDVKPIANGPSFQVRGANAGTSGRGHVQLGPANTMADYAAAIAGTTWPTVTHEMGQYVVFPDFRQIAKYKGASRASNLETFRKNVADAGLLDQSDDFARASGALAALCYREEIESCLRTPQYGGFELLDLQDYPGQGSALVGMLDAFMDPKGILTPEQWRRFCAPQVLLARFPKYIWTTSETLAAKVELAQYGDADLRGAGVQWTLADARGKPIRSGELPPVDAARGDVRTLGTISVPLGDVPAPARLNLEIAIAGTSIKTTYPIWVYPDRVRTTTPSNVTVARTFDAATEQALASGRRVLLVCDGGKPLARTVGGAFATDFWNFSFFHNKPATLGLLCDPASPALSEFPTESHTDWQWFDIAFQGQPLILDDVLPRGDRPIVQTIDNYERCHKLGLVFEAKVGAGRLLVCAADLVALSKDHPEARQLLASLTGYASSKRFDPHADLSVDVVRKLLRTTISLAGAQATASSFDKGWQNFSPPQLIDGNDDKGWKANGSGPSWCRVEFAQPTDLDGAELVWAEAGAGYGYVVESSLDGTQWNVVCDETRNDFAGARHELPLVAKGVRFVRLSISATPGHRPAAINELRFYAPH